MRVHAEAQKDAEGKTDADCYLIPEEADTEILRVLMDKLDEDQYLLVEIEKFLSQGEKIPVSETTLSILRCRAHQAHRSSVLLALRHIHAEARRNGLTELSTTHVSWDESRHRFGTWKNLLKGAEAQGGEIPAWTPPIVK